MDSARKEVAEAGDKATRGVEVDRQGEGTYEVYSRNKVINCYNYLNPTRDVFLQPTFGTILSSILHLVQQACTVIKSPNVLGTKADAKGEYPQPNLSDSNQPADQRHQQSFYATY